MKPRGDSFSDGLGCLFFVVAIAACAWFGYRSYADKEAAKLTEERAAAEARLEAVRADARRQLALDSCLQEADNRYWRQIKLNGREDKKKPGTWWAANHVWDGAASNKRNDIAECNIRYGTK